MPNIDHLNQVSEELNEEYNKLTKYIRELDKDLNRELDSLRKLVLNERKEEFVAQRAIVAQKLESLERIIEITKIKDVARVRFPEGSGGLWRLAYALLRLDQLPSGGWARSLPKWYQTLVGDTEESRARAYDYRKNGGMNLTCIALLHYTRALLSLHCERPEQYLDGSKNSSDLEMLLEQLGEIEKRNEVAQRVVLYIRSKINTEGAIPAQTIRNPDEDIHHTLLGIISLLLSYLLSARGGDTEFYTSLVAMCGYLDNHGRNAKLSKGGRRYEIYCATRFLDHLVSYDFFRTSDDDARAALGKLPEILNDIRRQASEGGTSSTHPDPKGKASTFLLNLPLLSSLGGYECLEKNESYIKTPLGHITRDKNNGLVNCRVGDREAVSDWGHTAEFWWAMTRHGHPTPDDVHKAVQTLLTQLRDQDALALTHGISFSSALGICQPPTREAFLELDEQVNLVLDLGATERNVLSLLFWMYHQDHKDLPLFCKDIDCDRSILEAFPGGHELFPIIADIKNLFINKLQPGSYVPTGTTDERSRKWQIEIERSNKDTKRFFDDALSEYNTTANERRLPLKRWFHLFNYLEETPAAPGPWILDVGCGSGAHAVEQFLPQGYRVHFYDCSQRILTRLSSQLSALGYSENDRYQLTKGNIEDLPAMFRTSSRRLIPPYRLIFADGVMFHLRKEELPGILSCFHEMLSSGGLCFANFKVNDHTLIGIDGRRFEYYASHTELQRMFEVAGFHVEDITMTQKSSSMYGSPYPTQWAHFICSKR